MSNVYTAVMVRNSSGNFLTLRRVDDGRYVFPGGKPEVGETLLQCAARELKEECGIEALSLEFKYVYKKNISGVDWTGYYFFCSSYLGIPRIQERDKHTYFVHLSLPQLRMLEDQSEYICASRLACREKPNLLPDTIQTWEESDGSFHYHVAKWLPK